jgi:hypothetical protein
MLRQGVGVRILAAGLDLLQFQVQLLVGIGNLHVTLGGLIAFRRDDVVIDAGGQLVQACQRLLLAIIGLRHFAGGLDPGIDLHLGVFGGDVEG